MKFYHLFETIKRTKDETLIISEEGSVPVSAQDLSNELLIFCRQQRDTYRLSDYQKKILDSKSNFTIYYKLQTECHLHSLLSSGYIVNGKPDLSQFDPMRIDYFISDNNSILFKVEIKSKKSTPYETLEINPVYINQDWLPKRLVNSDIFIETYYKLNPGLVDSKIYQPLINSLTKQFEPYILDFEIIKQSSRIGALTTFNSLPQEMMTKDFLRSYFNIFFDFTNKGKYTHSIGEIETIVEILQRYKKLEEKIPDDMQENFYDQIMKFRRDDYTELFNDYPCESIARVFIEDGIPINKLDEKLQFKFIQENVKNFHLIKNQSRKVIEYMLDKYPWEITSQDTTNWPEEYKQKWSRIGKARKQIGL